MNELALFAGYGGGILGTKSLGFRVLCAVEIDPFAASILIRRQNEYILEFFPIWDDIRTFKGFQWDGYIDMVSGGFPCQAFSTAARGRNNAANMWPEMRRVCQEVQPRYIFAENVTKKAIEAAAEDCANMGYKTEMLSLSAKDLGADHIRKRYWLLAYSDDKTELRDSINAKTQGMQKFYQGIWETNPYESGMVDERSGRMERQRVIGNGQVPAVAAAALWSLANA